MQKQKLFSVTMSDCELQTFRSGGKGGQNQNKVESGVRIIHKPSGAIGESRETRSQLENKQRAFKRMTETKEFKLWLKLEICKKMGNPTPEDLVKRDFVPENILVETMNEDLKWTKNEELKISRQDIENTLED